MRMTVSLPKPESLALADYAEIKRTMRFGRWRILAILTEPVWVYGKRLEFDVEAVGE